MYGNSGTTRKSREFRKEYKILAFNMELKKKLMKFFLYNFKISEKM